MTRFWLDFLAVPNHFLTDDVSQLPAAFRPFAADLAGRTMIVKKTTVIPVECVARGYLAGPGGRSTGSTARSAASRCPPG